MTGDILLGVALFAAGYVASIFTWPWIRTKSAGADAEIARLSTRIGKIMAAVRGE
jgi:hypothetical protein